MPREQLSAFVAALDPPLFDDVPDALASLGTRFRLALLTNNPSAAHVLERHDIASAFETVVIADPAIRKPDPRAFAPIIHTFGGDPRTIVYAGDSITADVEGAQSAELRPVWVDQ